MSAQDRGTPRSSTAIVVTTAAVTLALGVTAAALGGYLTPRAAGPAPAELAPVEAVPTLEATQPAAPPEPALLYAYDRTQGAGREHEDDDRDDDDRYDDDRESDRDSDGDDHGDERGDHDHDDDD